jgi:hypothetical protein
MPKTGIEIDTTEFNQALKMYLKVSKRDLSYICNKRAINIAFIAMRKTPSARAQRIERDLRKKISIEGRKPKHQPPRAALLIASGSRKSGREKPKPGLYGAFMRSEIAKLIDKRKRSKAYVKSGWLKAIRDLRAAAKEKRRLRPAGTRDFANPAGEGRAARPGINPTAEIINHAQAARKISGAALRHAFSVDAADMRNFAARQLRKRAQGFNR